MFFYKIKIFLLRVLGYDKPLRPAFLKYLSLKYKKFRPHYETILLESTIQAQKIGYKKVSVLELGVAGGNGILSLENYKKKIEKFTNVKIEIIGFDYGEGLPKIANKFDLPFIWSEGEYKIDKEKLKSKINSKIYFGDIKETFKEFIKTDPAIISTIFFDFDFYSSTKNFLNEIPLNKNYFCPRVYCYFDNVFSKFHYINEHNGELLAIREFNDENNDFKIGKSLNNLNDFKFPLGNDKLYSLHNFNHKNYFKSINNNDSKNSLSLDDLKVSKIID
ncbi:hypothetical protein OAR82_02300 [Candidatus Pelagibacter sp.]|nr:hypothetical protein [Candidatus Pelagibacter sp.]